MSLTVRAGSTLALTGLCWLALISDIRADAPENPPDSGGIMVLSVENDLFAGRDRWYTSGFQLFWLRPDRPAPEWLERLAGNSAVFAEDEQSLSWGMSLTQGIYTPRDITEPELPPDDRPYAGATALGLHAGRVQPRRLDRIGLHVGMVGPASGAGRTQRLVHELIGASEPIGWETQLPNEPIVIASYERSRRYLDPGPDTGDYDSEFSPGIGGAVGNAFNLLRAGAFYRIGKNIPEDFGPPRISPVPTGSGYFRPTAERGWYLYAGGAVRRVFHNLFLDGSLFQDTPSVESEPWTAEAYAGWVWYRGSVRLAYTHVWQTREFTVQETSDSFGSLSLSWRF